MEKTHQIVDFGPGPQDETRGYPFEGTEAECEAWLDVNQVTCSCGHRNRYAMQEIPL